MKDEKTVQLPEGRLCRMYFCGDCAHFIPNKYDESGELGNCERFGRMTRRVYDESCVDFE